MSQKNIHLMVIDPQNDFAEKGDSVKGIPAGSLYVPGGEVAMEKLCDLLLRVKDRLADVHVTLDSHNKMHIANPLFWLNSKGEHPKPFTLITPKEVRDGIWSAFNPRYRNRSLSYLQALEAGGRYPHVIWPEHCLIGSWGTSIHPAFYKALMRWEEDYNLTNYVSKGSNLWSEHFGALKAEVPDKDDPSTQLNSGLMQTLEEADEVVVAGIAGSHCVANSVLDIMNNFSNQDYIKKLVILTDVIPSVPGFEHLTTNFLNEASARGAVLSTSEKYLK